MDREYTALVTNIKVGTRVDENGIKRNFTIEITKYIVRI